MMLQQIIENYKKKSWLRLCTLHNINKWNLIDHLKEPIYCSRNFITPGLEVSTRVCFKCGKNLDLGIHKETFIAITTCKCASDGTNVLTLDKLRKVLTEEQAKLALNRMNFKKRKGLSNTVEFWSNKGFSEAEAKKEIIKVQKERSLKSPASKKGAREFSQRTVEFWIKKGFSLNESLLKVKEVQTTNGLAYYKNKYGESNGEKMFNKRIEQWLNAPGNKDMIANRSKKSLELFEQLGVGEYGPNERTVRGKNKVHRVDFLYDKKIIEYYGDYWHGNPDLFSDDFMIRKKKITDVWLHDSTKVQDLIANGYSVLIVWENDYKFNPQEVIQKCKDFIK